MKTALTVFHNYLIMYIIMKGWSLRSRKKTHHTKGQILLLLILVIAVVLTIVLSIAFKSRTESQITKLEEQNQRALAAAEAAIDATLRKGQSVNIATDLTNLTGITGSTSIDAVTNRNTFVSPLLQKDAQYTFYLVTYSNAATPPTSPLGTDYYANPLTISFGNSGPYDCSTRTAPALELTFITATNIVRHLVEPCTTGKVTGVGDIAVNSSSGYQVDNNSFIYQTIPVTPPAQASLLIARTLYSSTKVGISGTNLKAQGRYVSADVKTEIGVNKKVQLFQSFPQLPAEFFVTQLNN